MQVYFLIRDFLKHDFLKNNQGQSLVSVLVSGGILLIMIVAVLQLMDRSLLVQKGTEQSNEFGTVVSELNQIMSNHSTCTTAFSGQPVLSSGTTCSSANITTITWEGKQYLKTAEVKKGLTISKLCIKKIDDSWNLGDSTKWSVKLELQLDKRDNAVGRQRFIEEFYFNVKIDGSNNVTECIDYFEATPTPAPTPVPCSNPSGGSISHTVRTKTFTLSWTAGNCNGGLNGCKLQYQNASSTWVDLTNVNCDVTHTNAPFEIPGDGWYGGSWNGVAVPLRIIRRSDSAVMFSFNLTSCSTTGCSGSPTYSIDEDCDNYWDDNTGVPCYY